MPPKRVPSKHDFPQLMEPHHHSGGKTTQQKLRLPYADYSTWRRWKGTQFDQITETEQHDNDVVQTRKTKPPPRTIAPTNKTAKGRKTDGKSKVNDLQVAVNHLRGKRWLRILANSALWIHNLQNYPPLLPSLFYDTQQIWITPCGRSKSP